MCCDGRNAEDGTRVSAQHVMRSRECDVCSPPTIRHDGSVEERRGCTAPWDSQSDQEHHHERCHHCRPHRQDGPGSKTGESQHGHVRGDNSTVEYQGTKLVLVILNLYIYKNKNIYGLDHDDNSSFNFV